MLNFVIDTVKNNPIFAGLFLTMISGSIMYSLKALPLAIWGVLVREFTAVLDVNNDAECYYYLKRALSERYAKLSRFLSIQTKDEKWVLSVGYGFHLVFYKKRPIFFWVVDLSEKKETLSFWRQEKIIIRTFGRSKELIQDLIDEATSIKETKEKRNINIYTGGSWVHSHEKEDRKLDTIYLPDEQLNEILTDSEWFFKSKDWYKNRGIPYRRGYLFYGKPGNGKSSLALALASKFNKEIFYMNLNTFQNDTDLTKALISVPHNSILLIEDVDAINIAKERVSTPVDVNKPTDSNAKKEEKITLSGLLNGLDGITSSESRLLIMTTNHIDKLDSALIRPGRIDMKVLFDDMKLPEIKKMFTRFFPDAVGFYSKLEMMYISNPDRSVSTWQNIFLSSHGDLNKLELEIKKPTVTVPKPELEALVGVI